MVKVYLTEKQLEYIQQHRQLSKKDSCHNVSLPNLNEKDKIVDAASRNFYYLSADKADDYAHVVDEEIELAKRSIFHNENAHKKVLTKAILNEVTSAKELNRVMNTFATQKQLNDKLWDEDGKLKSTIRTHLLKIAKVFFKTLEIDNVKPKDIILTGSICNYNWNKFSDIDLHILLSFKDVDKNIYFVSDYFNAKKKLWNNQHDDLSIYGFPVELYVQDVNEEHVSSAIYSLTKDKWLKKPEYKEHSQSPLDKKKIINKLEKIIGKVDKFEKEISTDQDKKQLRQLSIKVSKLFDNIKDFRKHSLKTDGEFSNGNILFKALRRLGYIEKMINLKVQIFDLINSIEE